MCLGNAGQLTPDDKFQCQECWMTFNWVEGSEHGIKTGHKVKKIDGEKDEKGKTAA